MAGNNPPIIEFWSVDHVNMAGYYDKEDIAGSIDWISSETTLKFLVHVNDPDGSHLQHSNFGFNFVPKLILTNLDKPEEVLTIPMTYEGPTSTGSEEYYVNLKGDGSYIFNNILKSAGFKPGAWKFSFEVVDNQSHSIQEKTPIKLWNIGSGDNIVNTWFYGTPEVFGALPGVGGVIATIVTSAGYTIAGLMSRFPRLEMVARGISIGIASYELINMIGAFMFFAFTSNDTGTLFGMGGGLIMRAALSILSVCLADLGRSKLDFSGMGTTALITIVIQFVSLFLGILSQIETGVDIFDVISKWSGYALSLMASIMGLTMALIIGSGQPQLLRGIGETNSVKKIILIDSTITAVIGILCIIAFLGKTGYHHIN